MADKLAGKIEAVRQFVADSDEHPEVTLAMFRAELDAAHDEVREAYSRFALCPVLGDFGPRLRAATRRLEVLAEGLAALVGKALLPYDGDTWDAWLRDVAENDEDEDESGVCPDHGDLIAGCCYACEQVDRLVDAELERRAFGGL